MVRLSDWPKWSSDPDWWLVWLWPTMKAWIFLSVKATSAAPSCSPPVPLLVRDPVCFWESAMLQLSPAPSPCRPCTAHLFPITSSAQEPCLTGSLALLYVVSIFHPSLARFYKLPMCKHSSCSSIPGLYFCPLQLIACWLSNFLFRFLLCCMCHISAHNKQKCLVFQHYSAPHHSPAIPGVK